MYPGPGSAIAAFGRTTRPGRRKPPSPIPPEERPPPPDPTPIPEPPPGDEIPPPQPPPVEM